MRPSDLGLDAYLGLLRELPFVRDARVEQGPEGARADATLVLTTPEGDHRRLVETKRTHLTYAIADQFLSTSQGRQGTSNWILFTPYVPPVIGRHLASRGADFVDLQGNCHVRLGDRYIAVIEGRKPSRTGAAGRGWRSAGYQVLFAILAEPALLDRGILEVAQFAGVGKSTVAETFAKLEREGLLARIGRKRQVLKPRAVLDRWLHGYATVVRPRLRIGSYRTQDDDPRVLETHIEQVLAGEESWGWGGGAAALRLTQHYRGESTVLHLARPLQDLPKRLRALRDDEGALVLLGIPGPLAWKGALPRTVHPLLVYTELLISENERAREAALEIRDRYLSGLG